MVQCTLYTVQCTINSDSVHCTVHCTMYMVRCTLLYIVLYHVQFTWYSIHDGTVYSIQCTMYCTVQYTLCCTVYTVLYTVSAHYIVLIVDYAQILRAGWCVYRLAYEPPVLV